MRCAAVLYTLRDSFARSMAELGVAETWVTTWSADFTDLVACIDGGAVNVEDGAQRLVGMLNVARDLVQAVGEDV